MAYESVDKLQKVLAEEVFRHTKDPKKAAGRALGTLVEIITYYLLKTWGLNNQISIERGLAEYGNPEITHNVEYSLHPIVRSSFLNINKSEKSITSNVILKALAETGFDLTGFEKKNNPLLSNGILRNACTIATSDNSFLLCSIKTNVGETLELHIYEQSKKPYAMFECKRVGVEEGMTKGPQTIEKAKQGAYVARMASSLQKIRSENGEMQGIIYKSDGTYIIKPYVNLMEEIIYSSDKELLRKFILTVGVVSNHGNWIKKTTDGELSFSQENFQKELMVLAQSYDWLLFLTDQGLSDFIDKLLLHPIPEFQFLRDTFLASYTEGKKKNQFTKVQMNIEANRILLKYFKDNITVVESWFSVISPSLKNLTTLKDELEELKNKNWQTILK
ncbi:MAG: hypothetical protein EAZ70_02110 [Runella slithyformis]|nr:MAG: hypothetical protein EAY79_09045 [Runella slithyformis]TAF29261.1 MAG: hypothetical protein EAZ70_02110 [Runella slithyformis]TAF48278.1 MAG: hypothetical protein EAZ63_05125 [Runella slithyformis]TAF80096.1 MAG: hypothetical protein EAZ50_09710 [Runella slithyformis]TAH07074.1 MAG: hypothetical protein EAZ14_11755 [Runella slithyformis]